MQEILDFSRQQLKKSRESMKAQEDKHQKNVSYEVRDMIWLSGCNIKTTQSSCDLKDKQLRLFRIKEQVIFYFLFLHLVYAV